MPLFNLVCSSCGVRTRRLCKAVDLADKALTCESCGSKDLVREPDPPTTQVKEVLDNGIMTKRLERYADAERLTHDNAKVR